MTDAEHAADVKRAILAAALTHVPFDGWTQAALNAGAADAGYDDAMVLRAFPGGALEALEFWHAETDRAMAAQLVAGNLPAMKIRARIAFAVRTRLEILAPHREAVRRALSFLALPRHTALGMKGLYRTVDEMWYQAGDTATDFNFYTKRGLLAAVYTSTLLYWLDDKSENSAASWDFLDRRIANVMRVPQLTARLRGLPKHAPNPLRFIKRVRARLSESGRY